jgi:hypothetical protein
MLASVVTESGWRSCPSRVLCHILSHVHGQRASIGPVMGIYLVKIHVLYIFLSFSEHCFPSSNFGGPTTAGLFLCSTPLFGALTTAGAPVLEHCEMKKRKLSPILSSYFSGRLSKLGMRTPGWSYGSDVKPVNHRTQWMLTSSYGHRTLKTRLPVRSALVKQCLARLVLSRPS